MDQDQEAKVSALQPVSVQTFPRSLCWFGVKPRAWQPTVRQFGGVWRLEWGTFNPPAWAQKMTKEEVEALEVRIPLDMPMEVLPRRTLRGRFNKDFDLTRLP